MWLCGGVGDGGWELVSVCACLCVCGSQRSLLSLFLDCLLPCLLRQDLFLNLEFVDLARLAGQWILWPEPTPPPSPGQRVQLLYLCLWVPGIQTHVLLLVWLAFDPALPQVLQRGIFNQCYWESREVVLGTKILWLRTLPHCIEKTSKWSQELGAKNKECKSNLRTLGVLVGSDGLCKYGVKSSNHRNDGCIWIDVYILNILHIWDTIFGQKAFDNVRKKYLQFISQSTNPFSIKRLRNWEDP